MYSKILIATDGSELAGKGLEQGVGLAKALGAEVTVITVSEPWMPMGVEFTRAAGGHAAERSSPSRKRVTARTC